MRMVDVEIVFMFLVVSEMPKRRKSRKRKEEKEEEEVLEVPKIPVSTIKIPTTENPIIDGDEKDLDDLVKDAEEQRFNRLEEEQKDNLTKQVVRLLLFSGAHFHY